MQQAAIDIAKLLVVSIVIGFILFFGIQGKQFNALNTAGAFGVAFGIFSAPLAVYLTLQFKQRKKSPEEKTFRWP